MNYLLDEKLVKATVVNIEWERVNLYIDVKIDFSANSAQNIPLSFYAVNKRFAAKGKFKVIDISEDNVYRLYMNVTNPGYARCLPRGQYCIHVCYDDNDLAICMADISIVKTMNNYSRSFFFTAKTRVYNVFFYVDENDGSDLPFNMDILVSSATSMGNIDTIPESPADIANGPNIKEVKKKKNHKRRALKLRKLYFLAHKIFALYGRKGKPKILFMSEQNDYMGTNEEALYKRLVERGFSDIFDFTFSFRSSVIDHYPIRSWFKLIKLIGQASVIVLDDHAPIFEWLNAGKYSKIIQLWHAGAGFKSSGYSRWGHNGGPTPFGCHRQITYGVAGSQKVAHFFAEIWGINNENVLPTGLPRMDEYQDPKHRRQMIQQLYETFPIAQGKKVILFGPTYRGRNKTDAHYPYDLLDFDRLYDFCGDEYVVIFKMHPWVAVGPPIKEEHKDRFVDAGPLANINDIFYITDLLITDYSSNIYEYSLMRKPILFFAFDKIPYSFSRGFHRDYDIYTPGKIVENFDEMLDAIANEDYEIEKLYSYIDEQFDYFDSNASDRVIDWAILENMPDEFKIALAEREKENQETALLDFTPPLTEPVPVLTIVERIISVLNKFTSRAKKPVHRTTAPQIDIIVPQPEYIPDVPAPEMMQEVEPMPEQYAEPVGEIAAEEAPIQPQVIVEQQDEVLQIQINLPEQTDDDLEIQIDIPDEMNEAPQITVISSAETSESTDEFAEIPESLPIYNEMVEIQEDEATEDKESQE